MHADPNRSAWGWRLLALLVTIAFVVKACTWYRLRHIPGPPSAAFSKFWLLRKTLARRLHLDLAEACEKYGIVLILHTWLLISLLISNPRPYCTNWSERAGDEWFWGSKKASYSPFAVIVPLAGTAVCALTPSTTAWSLGEVRKYTMRFRLKWPPE